MHCKYVKAIYNLRAIYNIRQSNIYIFLNSAELDYWPKGRIHYSPVRPREVHRATSISALTSKLNIRGCLSIEPGDCQVRVVYLNLAAQKNVHPMPI